MSFKINSLVSVSQLLEINVSQGASSRRENTSEDILCIVKSKLCQNFDRHLVSHSNLGIGSIWQCDKFIKKSFIFLRKTNSPK